MRKRKSAARQLGRYIVADPEICHGKPTFHGTRIFVADVLEQVAEGLAGHRRDQHRRLGDEGIISDGERGPYGEDCCSPDP